jgi:hypothetical protein
MLQLESGSINHHDRPLQAFPPLLHFRPELFDHAIHHFPGYQFRQFLPRLAIASGCAGHRLFCPSLTLADQVRGATLNQVLDRRCQAFIPLQPLPHHQPHHHRRAVDAVPEMIAVLLAKIVEEPGWCNLFK